MNWEERTKALLSETNFWRSTGLMKRSLERRLPSVGNQQSG